MPPHVLGNKRRFNGKEYYLHARSQNKSSAEDRVKQIHKEGDHARLIKVKHATYPWEVYGRLSEKVSRNRD